ncbi:MAG: hypothetical protein M3O41_05535 [Pseudomonadota bacterium]|nr:hypothetical protein [Pseudomonadota bacterium]
MTRCRPHFRDKAAGHHAVESTIFPKDDVACMLAEKECRKLARLADPPLPPKSAISVSKLFCNEASAVLWAVLVAVPVEVLDAVLLEVEPVDDPVMD